MQMKQEPSKLAIISSSLLAAMIKCRILLQNFITNIPSSPFSELQASYNCYCQAAKNPVLLPQIYYVDKFYDMFF